MAEMPKVNVDVEVNDPNHLLTVKAGWKTTEFWIGLLMTLIGAWLIEKGKDELGAVLVAVGGLGYQGSRALVKKAPPRLISGLLLAALLIFAPGCNSTSMDADEVGPLILRVCDRHDLYVTTDPNLDDTRRESMLRSSHLLRVAVEAARSPLPDPDQVQTEDQDPPYDPCNWQKGARCGCDAVSCEMPCSGCCAGGCWKTPPDPARPLGCHGR